MIARTLPDLCSVEHFVATIGGRWKPLILHRLADGPCRSNELRRRIPAATQPALTAGLRELEADGLVARTMHASVPPRVEYELTDLGRSLGPILEAMAQWGERDLARRAKLSA